MDRIIFVVTSEHKLNFLYAILGIAVGLSAFASKPRAVKPQARFSGTGLVAALFKQDRSERNVTSLTQLFDENEPGVDKATAVHRVAKVLTMRGGLKFEILDR